MSDSVRETVVFVDRIEDDLAVVLVGDDQEIDLPLALLPEGAREGDWIRLAASVDDEETRARKTAVREIRERLSANDDEGDLDL